MRTPVPAWLIKWLVTTLVILAVPEVIPGVHVANFRTALAAGAVLGILNLLVKPLLILFTLPLTLVSLGLFLLFINAFIFELAGWLVSGFVVDSFSSAFLAALLVSLVSWLLNLSRSKQEGGRRSFVISGDWSGMPNQRRRVIDLNERRPQE